MLGNMLTRFSWTIKLARGRLGTRKLSLFRGFSTDFNRSLNKFRTSNIFIIFLIIRIAGNRTCWCLDNFVRREPQNPRNCKCHLSCIDELYMSAELGFINYHFKSLELINRYRTENTLARGLCVPSVDILLRASFYSASYFSTEIRAREFRMALKATHSPVSVKTLTLKYF